MKIQAVRGTHDILPREIWKWRLVEEKARRIFAIFGYEELRTPIFENTELFIRSVGETSDIVEKQMYTIPSSSVRLKELTDLPFSDKTLEGTTPEVKGKGLTLRPEATAPVVRAFLEHQLGQEDRLHKFFYIGPMFRHERPQAGRLRQFHQLGVEVLGSSHPAIDAEVLDLVWSFLKEMGLKKTVFKVNSVGCMPCKVKYGQLLRDSLRERVNGLCGDCQRRFSKNVLRVLDCKNPNCQSVLNQIPLLPEILCEDCKRHFKEVQDFLNQLGVPFEIAPKLVRGLDYYTRTIFEVTCPLLGSQDAIAAGGRYDGLIASMGGPNMGAVGFGMGIERLLLVLGESLQGEGDLSQPFLFLVSLGEGGFQLNFLLQKELRNLGISSQMDYESKSIKSQLRRAHKLKSKYVLLRADEEVSQGVVKFKDMEKGVEEEIRVDQAVKRIQEKFKEFRSCQ